MVLTRLNLRIRECWAGQYGVRDYKKGNLGFEAASEATEHCFGIIYHKYFDI